MEAAVTMDDVTDHVLPFDMGRRGGVSLQPSPVATVDHSLSNEDPWKQTDLN